jgi:pimeloyl-ACP methyl ester carboxylesterase
MTTVQLALSHRWRVPAHVFAVLTSDDVQIVGTRLGPNDADRPAVVLVHGLMGWHAKPRFAVFAEHLTEWFTVYAFDMRGHGGSGGVSDYGGAEIHDIDAVVALARREGHTKVVTIGTSQGGIAVLRHAGLLGGVDSVVGISSLAYWDWRGGADPLARRQLDARIGSRSGRAALRAWGVRLPENWDEPESPEEVVGKIAPTPVAIIHGIDDHLFAPDHARRLYEAAGEPKRLLLGDRFGHAEDGLTPAFERRLARTVFEMLELPWSE